MRRSAVVSWWRRQSSDRPRRPLRQYWTRTPTPTDALTGYVPGGLGLVDRDQPGAVFPDEIDPAWSDEDSNSDRGHDDGQVT